MAARSDCSVGYGGSGVWREWGVGGVINGRGG